MHASNIGRCNLGGRLSLLAPWFRLWPLIYLGFLFRVSDFSSLPQMTSSNGDPHGKSALTA